MIKQTAADYFFQQMLKLFMDYHEDKVDSDQFGKIIMKAKKKAMAMEKEQMIKAFNEGTFANDEKVTAEQYYNETYGN